MERHADLLKDLCRCCGRRVKSVKGRVPKDIKDYTEAAKYLNIFIAEDSSTVHPTKICESCRNVFSKIGNAIKNNKEYRPNLKVFNFVPHTEENCFICHNIEMSKSAGRNRALKQVNQYSESLSHCVVNATINEPESDKLQNIFQPILVKDFAESLGFAMVNSDDSCVMFAIFVRRDSPFLQIRNLLTVTITNECHWTVYIDDKNMTSENIFSEFDETLNEIRCKELLTLCTKAVFCCGNEDFVQLCDNRREEGNKVIFRDRKDNIIANEVTDVICLALGLKATIRHNSCKMLISPTQKQTRCDVCTKYRATLCALKAKVNNGNVPVSKRDSEISASSSVPHKFMSSKQLSNKLANRKIENQSLRKENKQLREKIKNLIQDEGVTDGDDMYNALKATLNEKIASNAKEFQFPEGSAMEILFDEQMKMSKLSSAKQMRWHPLVIRWCLGIYHTSPAAYEFIKRSCFLKLPHKNTLRDYTLYTQPGSGFNADVLERLYNEGIEELKPHQKNVSLLFDEMKIKADLVYNKTTGKLVGFVALDQVTNEIEKLERLCAKEAPEKEIATHVMAVMVRGIYTNLLFTIAYFPTKAITCDVIFPIAWNAVCSLECIGLHVRCFVCDGASSNRKFYKIHQKFGSKELPYFAINICNKLKKIYLICDVPHLIKTVRNNWENSHGNRNSRNLIFNNYSISWAHLTSLKNFDSNPDIPGLYLTKIRTEHVKLTPSSRMKVRLAAQCLSSTVADFLQYRDKPELKGTEDFCRKFDFFFDCLNGQYEKQGRDTEKPALHPYRSVDDHRFTWLEEDFMRDYIIKWQEESKSQTHLTKKERNKLCLSQPTLEGLQITVKSTVRLIKDLLTEHPNFYVLSGKFSQDPLEQHFSAQRRKCGFNTNPTEGQYAYSELSLHGIKSKNVASLNGNCTIPTEQQKQFMEDSGIPMKRRKAQRR